MDFHERIWGSCTNFSAMAAPSDGHFMIYEQCEDYATGSYYHTLDVYLVQISVQTDGTTSQQT